MAGKPASLVAQAHPASSSGDDASSGKAASTRASLPAGGPPSRMGGDSPHAAGSAAATNKARAPIVSRNAESIRPFSQTRILAARKLVSTLFQARHQLDEVARPVADIELVQQDL